MRWDMMSIKIEKDTSRSYKRIEALLIRIYAYILKLYPVAFRTDFADEMIDVFAMTLRETNGQLGFMLILWREIFTLPMSLIAVHRQTYNRLPSSVRRIQQARWFVRIIAVLLGVFLLSTLQVILSPSYHLYPQAIPFVLFLFITSISLLLAIRWERLGGLLTGSGGIALGIFMGLYLSQMVTSVEVSLIAIVLIGVLWSLPFVIFGVLFHQLSRKPKPQLSAV
jgi:hypothetical protein